MKNSEDSAAIKSEGEDFSCIDDVNAVNYYTSVGDEGRRPKREKSSRLSTITTADVDEPKPKRKSKKFQCTRCRKRKCFSTQKQLDQHIVMAHTQKILTNIICEICSASLKSETYLKNHILKKHPKTPKSFVCDFDGKTFAAKDYIRIHMDRHRVHALHTCSICLKTYISKHTFRRHLKMHIEKHICSVCGDLFTQKVLLQNHYTSKHSTDLPYKCFVCTRKFANKTARNNHQYIAHKNSKTELNFKCEECNIYFEMKEELRIHSFIHFNGEIRTCLECNQIFKTTRLLNIHMQKHNPVKSFQCPTCGDYFTFKTGLAKHIRLNRCKGSDMDKEAIEIVQAMDQQDIAEVARNQLNAISMPSKRPKKEEEEYDVMKGIKVESENSESDFEDRFDQFFDPPVLIFEGFEDEIKTEIKSEESDAEAKKTRKIRKQKKVELPIKYHFGRAHLIYTCDCCGANIKYKKEMQNHMKLHTIYQKYKCKECEESFKSRKRLVDHSLAEHGSKPSILAEVYACKVCDRKFDVRSIYLAHLACHESSRRHVCSICPAAFKSVGNLRRHEATHAPTRDFECSQCPKRFKTRLALKIHVETIHPEVRVYVNCTVCKAIILEKHLNIHMKNLHTDEGMEKPFSCTQCDKRFKTEKLGQRHYESIHEPKSKGIVYPCNECPLQFYRLRDLKQHSFTHFNGDVYQCDICLKMFKTKRLLMVHRSVHNDGTSYPCNFCNNVVFKTASGRRKHLQRVHNEPDQNACTEEIQLEVL